MSLNFRVDDGVIPSPAIVNSETHADDVGAICCGIIKTHGTFYIGPELKCDWQDQAASTPATPSLLFMMAAAMPAQAVPCGPVGDPGGDMVPRLMPCA